MKATRATIISAHLRAPRSRDLVPWVTLPARLAGPEEVGSPVFTQSEHTPTPREISLLTPAGFRKPGKSSAKWLERTSRRRGRSARAEKDAEPMAFEVPEVTVEEVAGLVDAGALLLDVREADEWQAGHAAAALAHPDARATGTHRGAPDRATHPRDLPIGRSLERRRRSAHRRGLRRRERAAVGCGHGKPPISPSRPTPDLPAPSSDPSRTEPASTNGVEDPAVDARTTESRRYPDVSVIRFRSPSIRA